MTKSIDFYFDFISPYSYLAHKKIRDFKEKGINFNYKPILVGGLHNLQGITAPAFIKPKLNHMIQDCILFAKKDNFNLSFILESLIPSKKLFTSILHFLRSFIKISSFETSRLSFQ